MEEEKYDSATKLDAEYGIDLEDLKKKLVHDVDHIDVDLDSLTSGQIDWVNAVQSLQWMVDKASETLTEHKGKEEDISQYLAKTCVMHVIHCFHHCRSDKAPGYAHEGGSIPPQPPSEKE